MEIKLLTIDKVSEKIVNIKNINNKKIFTKLEELSKNINFGLNYDYICKIIKDDLIAMDKKDNTLFVLKSPKKIYVVLAKNVSDDYFFLYHEDDVFFFKIDKNNITDNYDKKSIIL